MLKWLARQTRTSLILALFLAFLSACIFGITFSSSYQSCVTSEHPYQTTQEEQSTLHRVRIFLGCEVVPLNENAGALTALGTLAIAFFTLALWAVTGNALRLARDEFNATHRPQIMVHGFDLTHEYRGDEGEAISAEFVVVNKGTTDAVLEDISGIIFAARHLRPGSEMRSLGHKGHVLTSGETLNGIGIDGTPASTHAAQIEFDHGYGATPRQILWCVGKITYADRQGRRRETGFCRRYDPEGHRWLREPNSDYEYSY